MSECVNYSRNCSSWQQVLSYKYQYKYQYLACKYKYKYTPVAENCTEVGLQIKYQWQYKVLEVQQDCYELSDTPIIGLTVFKYAHTQVLKVSLYTVTLSYCYSFSLIVYR